MKTTVTITHPGNIELASNDPRTQMKLIWQYLKKVSSGHGDGSIEVTSETKKVEPKKAAPTTVKKVVKKVSKALTK